MYMIIQKVNYKNNQCITAVLVCINLALLNYSYACTSVDVRITYMHMDVLVNHVSLNLGEHMFSVSVGIAIASYRNIIILLENSRNACMYM